MLERIQKYRRDLHQIPELELELPKTQRYLQEALRDLPCSLSSPIPSSVVAFFDAGKKESIAFRSDMDALPVTEATGRAFASRHTGCMHACGHDGHMAMLLEFAYQLSAYYKELPHNVVLIFQPGEETPGGAEPMCKSGIFEQYHIKRIFGFHVWPMLDKGVIATRRNEFMARSSEVNIDITGKSAHAAKYQEGIDAMEIAARYLLDLYTMEQEELSAETYRLLRFGLLKSGTVRNVVSNAARMEGTLRAFQDETYQYMKKRMLELAKPYEEQGAVFSFDINTGYPAVMNDAALVDQVLKLDPNIVLLEKPKMISEDFAHYQRRVPGVFFFLGTGTGIALHAHNFDFDEEALEAGVREYCKLSRME